MMRIRRLRLERLEHRLLLDATGLETPSMDELEGLAADEGVSIVYESRIVAGDPTHLTDPDSPGNRVTTDFPAVGSLFLRRGRFTGGVCTGTLITPTHVLTAGHCVDSNDDGVPDYKPGNVSFFVDGNTNYEVVASTLTAHPDYSGFNNPYINDDIAIVTLSQPVPIDWAEPVALRQTQVSQYTTMEMVGFGRSGDGVNGFTIDASLTIKRVGYNAADILRPDDEGSGSIEIWEGDFDHPTTPVGYQVGGASLGNTLEANLGNGDSGGPSFVDGDLAAINTYGFSYGGIASPKFGTGLGGILVYPYLGWINDVINGNDGGGDGGGGSGGGRGNGRGKKSDEIVWSHDAVVDVFQSHGLVTNPSRAETDTSLMIRDLGVEEVWLRSAPLPTVSVNLRWEAPADTTSNSTEHDDFFAEIGADPEFE